MPATIEAPVNAIAPDPAAPHRRSVGAAISGSIMGVIGSLALLGGGGLMVVHATARDHDGFYTSPDVRVASPGYAITAPSMRIGDLGDDGVTDHIVRRVRIKATTTSGKPVFVGIAPTADVQRYLAGVRATQVDDVDDDHVTKSTQIAGGAPATRPDRQRFWTASVSGTGTQTLETKVPDGDSQVVIMSPDNRRGVSAEASFGAKTDLVLWIGLGLAIAGAMFAVAGGLLVRMGMQIRA